MEKNSPFAQDIPYVAAVCALLGVQPENYEVDQKGYTTAIYRKGQILPAVEDIALVCNIDGEKVEVPFLIFEMNLSHFKGVMVEKARGKRKFETAKGQ